MQAMLHLIAHRVPRYSSLLPMTTSSQKAAFEEGVALSLLRELGDPDAPISAFALAHWCGLDVELWPGSRSRLAAGTIYVSAKAERRTQHAQCAHELGHWALARYGIPDSERAAEWVAAALLLPRAALLRDVTELGHDLDALARRHTHCPRAVIAWRLKALEWQQGECP